ncbi:Predicted outer membrane protein [Actinomyces bovis]|uniref:Predicted outer membrane protein n=1 Tax=Actinomyces bovis TaxID=1658 RepID=A0ABY1VLH0_9ACTO|nr:SpaA isopeptide-forming pilin-related protein [Actinomyces bovis]SPT52930.1 Predicted outer membrane protein [Actinomyces bovis]VEG55099.1 Predicted outer membrane protein [Actinomyces israelii]
MTRSIGLRAHLSGLKVRLLLVGLALSLPLAGLWGGAVPAVVLGTPAFAANEAFSCQSGNFYSLSDTGDVYKIDSGGNLTPISSVPDSNRANDHGSNKKKRLANALGIGRGGQTAYALWRHSDDKASDLYSFEVGKGWKFLQTFNYSNTPVSMVAGGVQFSTGDFYFGGFYKDGTRKFRLYRYLSRTGAVEFVGQFNTGIPVDGTANGDLAFDSAGNLYIVRHKGGSEAVVYTVAKEDLEAANGGNLRFSENGLGVLDNKKGINGAAFRSDGSIVLGDSAVAKAYDPADFTQVDFGYEPKLSSSSDLASCSSPATFILKKDIVSRINDVDQFKLKVSKQGSNAIATGTTSGQTTGLQDSPSATAGIFPVKNNQKLNFSEEMASGSRSKLSEYQTTWACYADGSKVPFEQGVGQSGSVNLPNTLSVVVECVLKNGPQVKAGSVTWKKTAADTGKELSGSEWELRPSDGSAVIKVVDNGSGDTNNTPGVLKVENVPLGNYKLVETKAPEGYVAGEPQTIQVKEAHAATPFDLKNIDNTRIKGSVTWVKVDRDRKPLGGSSWTLTSVANAAARLIDDCQAKPCGSSGDQDERPGYFKLEQVEYGTYTLTETTAPNGYVKSEEAKTVEVTKNGVTVEVGQVVNQALPQVAWTKTKPDNSLLGGSTWSWQPSKPGQQAITVTDCVATEAKECKDHDKDPNAGKFLLTAVEIGTYTLTESAAPEGYVKDSNPKTVTVATTDVGKTVNAGSFVNQEAKGLVTWKKVDAANNKPLGGSSWTLTGPAAGTSAGAAQLVDDCVASDPKDCIGPDKDPEPGQFKVEGLSLGKYTLVEKAAPAGYRLDAKEHPFTLDAVHPAFEFKEAFGNHKITVPVLPLTGGMGADTFLIGGSVFAGLALIGAMLRRRRAD